MVLKHLLVRSLSCTVFIIVLWKYCQGICRHPVISVLVPVFNSAAYLDECLQSIGNQSLPNYEVIIVDDGSTDSSLHILKKYAKQDRRIHVIRHRGNRGSMLARKTAVYHAKGRYCCFLDPDDYFPCSNALSSMVELITTYNVDMVQFSVTAFRYQDHREDIGMNNYLKVYESALYGNKDILEGFFFHYKIAQTVWNKVYRTTTVILAFQNLPDQYIPVTEDLCISFVLAYYSSSFIGVVTQPLYAYRVGCGKATKPVNVTYFQTKVASQFSVLHIIELFLNHRQCLAEFEHVLSEIRRRTLINQLKMLDRQSDGNFPVAFQILTTFYSPEDLVAAMSMMARKPRIYRLLLSANTLPVRSNLRAPIQKVGIYCAEVNYSKSLFRLLTTGQLRLFDTENYNVTIITKDTISDLDEQSQYRILHLPENYHEGRIRALADAVRNEHFDLMIYDFNSDSVYFDVLLLKLYGVPLMFCPFSSMSYEASRH